MKLHVIRAAVVVSLAMVASGGAAQSLIQEMMRSMNPASMMG